MGSEAESNQAHGGLMQLMPETAQDMIAKGLVDGSEYSAGDLNDPATNIEFGCAYLSYLLTYFNGSTDSAIAAYTPAWAMSTDGRSRARRFIMQSLFPRRRRI